MMRSSVYCLLAALWLSLLPLFADLSPTPSATTLCPGTPPEPAAVAPLRIAFFNGEGTGPSKIDLQAVLRTAPDMEPTLIGAADVRPEVLANFDVVVFPGGSGSKQGKDLGENGRAAVEDFVAKGGGCVGVCAGAYLCTNYFSWSLDFVDADVFTGAREIEGVGEKQMWYRGKATEVDLELTDEGQAIFPGIPKEVSVRYANGPIVSPGGAEELDDYTALAHFRSEKVLYEPQRGTMIGTPAIVSSEVGDGRIISISPHPEFAPALHSIIANAVRWVAGRPSVEARPEQAINTPEIPEVTAKVREEFPLGTEGGFALLVVREGEIIHSVGYGLSGDEPVIPTSPMSLASIAKQFAAASAALLIDDGKLTLDDPLTKHLPDLEFSNPGRPLQIKDLIYHIGGLPNFLAEGDSIAAFREERGIDRLDNKTHAEWVSTYPLDREPGLQYEYANSGYVLLARIVEVVAGKPFHQFLQERIFDPLEMVHSRTSTRFNGSGNTHTSLLDYARWDQELREPTLFNPETAALLFQSGTLDDGEPIGYGFGWHVTHDGDGKLLEAYHGGAGSPPGNARNFVFRDIANDITAAVFMTNFTELNRKEREEFTREVVEIVLSL